ncbi:glycine--tRNA ligase subunit beta [Luteitalea sp.]|jgi:glycyl-tRNA synthetase beta chain|uniref:glycine--tRNA ligase subunit beta n=1 Tax=Luteitalea sp. TaxID=2004800 RepID=UPI0037CB5BF0
MDRELLLEIGCEELPASWLPGLTEQLAQRLGQRLKDFRLTIDGPVESSATPRRLTAHVSRLSERQSDLEENVSGPAVSAAFGPDGTPTPAAVGFARKHGVEVGELLRVTTPKGEYLSVVRRERGKATVDVLPDVLAATLRDLAFPKQMRWDAWLDDGKGEFTFGRPIRWMLFLFGGRVVPFVIRRNPGAQSNLVQDIRTGPLTYGHRFLAMSGRPGRSVKVRSVSDYKQRLGEHFVLLEHSERHDRLVRELDAHARRLGGRVASQPALLHEVADLVEYPSVVAGVFPPEFLALPDEVLSTTMIHHQHYFPVLDDQQKLLPAFLAVTNIEVEQPQKIAINAERVLTARLRDARFFWDADRRAPLEAKLARLDTLLFHKALGSYAAKAERLGRLAGWIVTEAFGGTPAQAEAAATAGRLAKADLTTDMVREFTELQGQMGGIYAREDGLGEMVWKAIHHQYQPLGVEAAQPPSAAHLGEAAITWAAVTAADRLDTLVGLFAAGEVPTGTRDPFALRRAAQGLVKVLVDLPEVGGVTRPVALDALVAQAQAGYAAQGVVTDPTAKADALGAFVVDRLRFLFEKRGYKADEIAAVLPEGQGLAGLSPLSARQRLDAVRAVRPSADFEPLAALFKRASNIVKDVPPADPQRDLSGIRAALQEPAEQALADALESRRASIAAAVGQADYVRALQEVAALRPAVDRFFTDVFVMADDAALRQARLGLLAVLRDSVRAIADLSSIAGPQA